jgi:hypothetical protein
MEMDYNHGKGKLLPSCTPLTGRRSMPRRIRRINDQVDDQRRSALRIDF